jgi:hypothetical protein
MIAVFTPVVSADALNVSAKPRGVTVAVRLTSGVTVSQLWDDEADTGTVEEQVTDMGAQSLE